MVLVASTTTMISAPIIGGNTDLLHSQQQPHKPLLHLPNSRINSHSLSFQCGFGVASASLKTPPVATAVAADTSQPTSSDQTSIHLSSSKGNYLALAIKSKSNKDADCVTSQLTPAAIREELLYHCRKQRRRRIITATVTAATSIGLVVMLMGHDNKAWALGPEGPLVEEFWENVRRYALYALTVSTGVLYAVLQPIVELLKNPISAILVIIIFAATFFIFSQVLSAMFGVSEFAYQYAY